MPTTLSQIAFALGACGRLSRISTSSAYRFLDRLAGHFDHKSTSSWTATPRTAPARSAPDPDRIELHFLPASSPELNPDELVNADLKWSLPMRSRARDQAQLAAGTRRFFHRRQRQPHIVRGYFGGPHVR
ncbi:transposase [Streptomyces sp. NBC_01361]|uniref:transposase n=1 Tax=Streptomyces sp. NBC_01361 TaxID=2903838 RepID=UPI002E30E4A8|nr:transposase [Streptomyces sp. NBC_01361]